MGSTALLAAGLTRPAFAQADALRLYWWGGQTRADRTLAVADLWAKAKGATAPDGEFGSFADHWPKLATQVAGGNAPDVFQMDYRFIVEYASRGAIAAARRVRRSGVLNLDDFDADQIEGGKVDGKLYGISLGANSVAAIYNQTALRRSRRRRARRSAGATRTYPAMAEAFLSATCAAA